MLPTTCAIGSHLAIVHSCGLPPSICNKKSMELHWLPTTYSLYWVAKEIPRNCSAVCTELACFSDVHLFLPHPVIHSIIVTHPTKAAMDVGTLLSAVQTLFAYLQCSELRELCCILGYKQELKSLEQTVNTIKAVLLDAESQQVQPCKWGSLITLLYGFKS